MMKNLTIFLLILALGLHVSCGGNAGKARTIAGKERKYEDPYPLPEDAASVPVSGKYGGRVVTASLADPKSFNPLMADDADSQTYNHLMQAGLTRLNLLTQQPEPYLAKSWDAAPDQLAWTFHLRKGLKWSDGASFTAADVIFTMRIVSDPNIPSSTQDALTVNGKQIGWTQIDENTVRANLPSIFAPFLRQLDAGTAPIVPKHKWETLYREGKFQQAMQVSMNPKDLVCLGPFELREYKYGQKVTLVRNPHYWRMDRDGRRLPYLDELLFLILPNQDQIELKIENGEIDTFSSIRAEDVAGLEQKAPAIRMKVLNAGPSFDTEGMFFNQNGSKNPKTGKPFLDTVKRSWFTDPAFRKAVSYAIDRKALAQNALFGKGVPAYGPESASNTVWYDDRITKYEYDPGKSLQLLKASGFICKEDSSTRQLYDRKGNEVRFSLFTNAGNTVRNTQCMLIASDLKKLGMQVEYSPLDFNTLVTRILESFDFDAAMLGLTHDDIDPASGMSQWMSSGSDHFWWPEQQSPQTPWEKRIDELMILQAGTFDPARRKQYYDEVQEILADQQPMIYTTTPFVFVCAKEDIGNLKPVVARPRTLWNADELYWKNP